MPNNTLKPTFCTQVQSYCAYAPLHNAGLFSAICAGLLGSAQLYYLQYDVPLKHYHTLLVPDISWARDRHAFHRAGGIYISHVSIRAQPLPPGVLCTLVLLELGFGFTWVWRAAVTGATEVQLDALGQEIEWDITSFFVISAFVDVFITISITYQLTQSRSSGLKRTKHLIDGIIRLTIPTGMLTSFVAIVIVFLWNLDKGTFNWVGVCILEPCCYATGLLACLTRGNHTSMLQTRASRPCPCHVNLFGRARPAGISPSSGTAAIATILMAHHFPSTPPRKEVQTTEQAESQDQDIHNLKSSFPVSS
ncbi:hypothetical protein BD779DRAFT_1674980 [Infundibulicybe gibba]|nr:hypothetical protein BD779DRAFT_1674980 [Infundibulicybe gibba]